ncbi:rhamnogalacturonan acetylesterase [Simiduia litorea]|uniref:rhamnogalacturonan acetylesterase n=1 Tax=Simiduia litorea TaxID=1435348 RepID=UPI0036F28429
MRKIKSRWVLTLAFSLFPLSVVAEPVTLHLAGDSTMAEKDPKDYPETGWGQPFSVFFDSDTKVINYAKNGRSTRTFKSEGRWKKLLGAVTPGDYVFIQFGHNDESLHKKDRYTTPETFYNNLAEFVQDTRAKKATPILLTPVTRRYFDGKVINETHAEYSALTRKLAVEKKLALIDMDTLTRAHFSAQGDELSKLRFMHLAPGLHPNYPKGVTDDTHFNELGAREAAQLVLQDLIRQDHPLAQRLRLPDPKHLQ